MECIFFVFPLLAPMIILPIIGVLYGLISSNKGIRQMVKFFLISLFGGVGLMIGTLLFSSMFGCGISLEKIYQDVLKQGGLTQITGMAVVFSFIAMYVGVIIKQLFKILKIKEIRNKL